MNKIKDYNILKQTLDRWYAGCATHEEELALTKFFTEAEGFPEEFRADRELFLSLSTASAGKTALPEDYKERLSSMMEEEFASVSPVNMTPLYISGLRRRVWWGIAAAVAVVLACVPFIRQISIKSDGTAKTNVTVEIAATGESKRIAEDTLTVSVATAGEPLVLASARPPVTRRVEAKKVHTEAGEEPEMSIRAVEKILTEGSEVSPPEDLPNHISAQYHVVDNEEEAGLIINSIFSKLDANVKMENMKLSKVSAEYDLEMVKLNVVENLGILGEYYNEKYNNGKGEPI